MSGDRSQVTRRAGVPPGPAVFEHPGDPTGAMAATLRLPGLAITVAGMDAAWQREFLDHYGLFARPGAQSAAALTLQAFRSAAIDHFIAPPAPGAIEYVPVFVAVEPAPDAPGHWRVRACSYDIAMQAETSRAEGTLILSRETFEPRRRGVENMLRVAVAWMAHAQGGMLIHAASIVRDDRAHIFFGASGAGKSTLAASTRRGQVVSDDLSLLLPAPGGGLELVGTPFRGTWAGGPHVTGRWPLIAAFHLNKAAPFQEPRVSAMSPARAVAAMTGNLPFVVDQLSAHPELMPRIEPLLRGLKAFELTFRKDDDSFWKAIEAAGS